MGSIIAWLKQPTSVAGISAVFGTISAMVMHQLTWSQAAPLVAGALVSIILPDNTAAKGDAVALGKAIVAKFDGH